MVGVTDISACEKQSHAFWRTAETMINRFCGRHLGPQFVLDLDHCFCCSDVFIFIPGVKKLKKVNT